MPIQLAWRRAQGGLAGHAAGADDDGVRLVVAAAAQAADGRPAQPPRRQHQHAGQDREQHHRGPRLVGVVEVERRRHHQQRQQRRPLEDADDFLAEAAQAVDGVLAGQTEGDGGQQHDQRQVEPAQVGVGRVLGDRDPAGLEAQVVGPYPRGRGQEQVPDEEPGAQDLAALTDHDPPRPWGCRPPAAGRADRVRGQDK